MKRMLLSLLAIIALTLFDAAQQPAKAQTSFRIFEATNSPFSSGVVLSPTYVNARSLAASTAESFTVPAGARFVIFSATCNFYANPTTTATVPGDTTDGSAAMLNPSAWFIQGVTTISVIAGESCVVTASFYI